MRHAIAALGVLLLAPLAAWAEQPSLVSGTYEDAMLIGYDPATRIISGYFDMERGEQPSFSCIFFLRGKLEGSGSSIRTYFPQTPADDLIAGRLEIQSPRQFEILLRSEHGGCWNVQHFADKDQPARFDLQTAHPWKAVAVVKSAKTYFFATPTSPAHLRAYLVKGDGVGVRSSRPGWLEVDYVGDRKTISGWLRQAGIYPSG